MGVHEVHKLLVVGLGNLPYPRTRHSVGQLLVDAIAAKYDIHMASVRGGYLGQGDVQLGDKSVQLSLYKSRSAMNISGPPIAAVCRRMVHCAPNEMLVLQDSLSHRPQTLSVRLGGSANGHNGVRSIISAMGNELGFWRFRVGIREKEDKTDAAELVMQNLTQEEQLFWTQGKGLDLVTSEMAKVVLKNKE